MIVSSYPDMLEHLRVAEDCVIITARRLRYFRMFGGRPYTLPGTNDNRAGNRAKGHDLPISVVFHGGGN